MSHRQRLWLTTLILAGVFLAASLVTPPGGAPSVIAQVATPTLTPVPAVPTPTRTSEELVGVAPTVDWLKELWDRFGWWAVPLALLGVLGAVVYKFIEGAGEGIKGLSARVERQRVSVVSRCIST